jgi:hypothetical protein
LALPRNSECLEMNAFFRGITETVPSLFRGIFSERNSVPNPNSSASPSQRFTPLLPRLPLSELYTITPAPSPLSALLPQSSISPPQRFTPPFQRLPSSAPNSHQPGHLMKFPCKSFDYQMKSRIIFPQGPEACNCKFNTYQFIISA